MRKLIQLFVPLLMLLVLASACKKDEFDADAQFVKDEQSIKDFLTANNLTAERHKSGLYYIVEASGSGSFTYSTSTSVTVKYSLRLINGTVVPQTSDPISFSLGEVILGWQIGVPLIQKGGKIRLFVPSAYAYGQTGRTGIPANSVLDFTIELLDVTNNGVNQ